MYDLLIKGGRVLDPARGVDGLFDVAVSAGRIAAVRPDIPAAEGRRVISAPGRLVTPGLIDMHTHVAAGLGVPGVTEAHVEPDAAGVLAGVTTVVDAGSTGPHTYGALLREIPRARTRTLAYLHICRTGQAFLPEPYDSVSVDPETTAAVIAACRETLLGVKVRMVSPGIDTMGLDLARASIRAARESRTAFMVHIGDTSLPPSAATATRLTPRMLDLMGPGDIVTHVYTANAGGLLDDNGRVLPQVRAARERGVLFDAAHGRRNLSFDAVRRLHEQGIVTDAISSDLTIGGRGEIVYSLTECMSKFLMLGMSLQDVVEKVTAGPARVMGMADRLGSLEPGRNADISVIEVVEGEWVFADAFGRRETGRQAIVPVLAVRAGEPIAPGWGPHPWGWLPEAAR
jgi:dihydroorotase